jgi:polyadenylate-binding protein
VSCKLEVNQAGVSKGFCYVQYETKEAASLAIEALNGSIQQEKEIQVLLHSKKGEREDPSDKFRNLFVKNIPTNFTNDELKSIFQEFGNIQSCEVKGSGSDIGYVMFETHEQAKAAVEALDTKKVVNGKTLFVSKFIYSSENDNNKSQAPPISQQLN